MSTEAQFMLTKLAEWNGMSVDDREMNIGLAALTAEGHFQALVDAPFHYAAWLGLVFSHGPLPLPFVRRGDA